MFAGICDKYTCVLSTSIIVLNTMLCFENQSHYHGIKTHKIQFGLAVRHEAGKQRDLGLNPLQLSFLFKSCGLWTLSCDFVPHN